MQSALPRRRSLTLDVHASKRKARKAPAGPRPPPVIPQKAVSPERLQQASASHFFEEKLKAASLCVVGDDTQLNSLVAKGVAKVLGYTPIATEDILRQLTNGSVEQLLEEEGPDQVALKEVLALEQLGVHIRCVVATLGGGYAAAARADCWRHLYGQVGVWVDVNPEQTEDEALQRGAYEQAEIHVKLDPEVLRSMTSEAAAEQAVAQVLPALNQLLSETGPPLGGKKLLYIKLGSRGDWPDIMPPEWDPDAPAGEEA